MGDLNKNKVKKNYTLVSESIYDYVSDGLIKITDIVVYTAVKTQRDGGYGSSLSDIHRVFNIPFSSLERVMERLKEHGLVTVEFDNGKAICKEKKFPNTESDRIPKTLLMSKDLDLRNKAFLMSVWIDVEENGLLNHTKKSLHSEIFKELGVGITWVTSRITELSALGLLNTEGRKMFINLDKIINMSDVVIADVLKESSDLEDIVVEYEDKTGILRSQISEWNPESSDKKPKDFSSPKWLQPIIDALNEGCVMLNKDVWVLNSGELGRLGDNIKEIIGEDGSRSQDEVIKDISDSIIWKAERVIKGVDERKWWNKGYFTRQKNNLKVNLYYFSEDIKKYPFAKKSTTPPVKKVVKEQKKVVSKSSTPRKGFNYGFEL